MATVPTPEQAALNLLAVFVAHFNCRPGESLGPNNIFAVWNKWGLHQADLNPALDYAQQEGWVDIIRDGDSFRLTETGFAQAEDPDQASEAESTVLRELRTNMADYRKARLSVLEFLRDVRHGWLTVEQAHGLGVNGEHIYNHLGEGLTPDEFKAQLDYLEEKGTIIRKPPKMPGGPKTKAEEMKLSWYSITASGMDEIENKAIEKEIHTASDKTSPWPSDRPRVFIVYGHDPESLEKLDHLLRKIGFDPETFDSLKKEGSETVIEILERNMPTCDAVIALLTPDDEGRKCSASDEPSETLQPLRPRARQNVLIEAGYAIISKRRRSLIVALGGVEIPSDFEGIHRLQADSWNREIAGKIAKRFSQMGFNVNLAALV